MSKAVANQKFHCNTVQAVPYKPAVVQECSQLLNYVIYLFCFDFLFYLNNLSGLLASEFHFDSYLLIYLCKYFMLDLINQMDEN